MPPVPRGGRGSNQYQTKGAPQPASPVSRREVAAAAQEPDSEQVAWAFHPDREAWESAGFGIKEAQSWITAGGTVNDALAWRDRFGEFFGEGWVLEPVVFVAHLDYQDSSDVMISANKDDLLRGWSDAVKDRWTQDMGNRPMPQDYRMRLLAHLNRRDVQGEPYLEVIRDGTGSHTEDATVLIVENTLGNFYAVGDSEEDLRDALVGYVNDSVALIQPPPFKPGELPPDDELIAWYFENTDENLAFRTIPWAASSDPLVTYTTFQEAALTRAVRDLEDGHLTVWRAEDGTDRPDRHVIGAPERWWDVLADRGLITPPAFRGAWTFIRQ